MSEWLLVLILAACGAGFLAVPVLRARNLDGANKAPPETVKNRSAVLEDVDDDIARHRHSTATQRRESSGNSSLQSTAFLHMNRLTAVGIAAVIVAGTAGLYVATGQTSSSGEVPAMAVAGTPLAAQPKLPDVDTMIARVMERLKTSPGNAEDWRMLGWSYFETQRYPEAVDAYSHAVALQPQSASFQSAYGEAQVLAAGGKVTPEALKAFGIAFKGTPNDERALHFIGLAKSQSGDAKGALADWMVALKNAKADSLWAPRLRAEINETAKAASIDVSAQLPPSAPMSEEKFAAPAGQAVQQAQSMTPEEQQSMIRNMVASLDERLTRNPRDRDGWVRLIRSRKVLGEPNLARSALDRALKAFQDDPPTQVALKAAAVQLGVATGG